MSATYNWAYKPGIANKYGITINASAENVRPSNFSYVALFGNDITGNGSRQYPYRTLAKGISIGVGVILASGVYREGNLSIFQNVIGDGDVTIDPSFVGGIAKNDGGQLYNLKITASSPATINLAANINALNDCIITPYNSLSLRSTMLRTVFIGNSAVKIGLPGSALTYGTPGSLSGNNTFVGFGDIPFDFSDVNSGGSFWNSIFVNSNISIQNAVSGVDFSLFYNCKFRIGSSGSYTAINDLPTLLAFVRASYPTILGFTHCIIADPKFNNAAIGDYSLAFDSPAKNLTYFGTYIGARSIGRPIKARASESAGGFEFSSMVNLTIADDSITLTNPAFDAQVDTNVIVNTLAREIANLPAFGFNADRNGQYIDSIADLDGITKSPGDTLTVPAPFIVEIGAIVYNGTTYQPGDRFTTVIGQTTFTSVAGGALREILEAPQRHTVMARFSDGGATVSAGTALTTGCYYYISSGSVVYNSNTYNAGDVFKAVDTNAFSGSGNVHIAFAAESFQHYEPGIKPTSNNVGDSRTGAILRGNGDPGYARGGLSVQEFPINAKFIQIRYFIRVNNLKP